MRTTIALSHIYVSPGHNFFGHHGRAPGEHPAEEVAEAWCVAGSGIEGDRFFDHGEDYKGQVSLFEWEVYESLCARFGVWNKTASAFRRNLITRGADLRQLIGVEFEVQGVRFLGTEECRPCHWMDVAFCVGAEAALQGRGGLRARILSTGRISSLRPVRPRICCA